MDEEYLRTEKIITFFDRQGIVKMPIVPSLDELRQMTPLALNQQRLTSVLHGVGDMILFSMEFANKAVSPKDGYQGQPTVRVSIAANPDICYF